MMSGVDQRTAMVILGGLVGTLAVFLITGSHALVGAMGVVLVMFMLSQQGRRP
jgi:hypothetical protein